MKLLCYQESGAPRCAVLMAEHGSWLYILDLRDAEAHGEGIAAGSSALAALAETQNVADLAAAPPAALNTLRALAHSDAAPALQRRIARSSLLAPIPVPRRNVFAVGRNYLEHVREGDLKRGIQTPVPQHPQFFTKPPSTVIGDGAAIEIEPAVSEQIDYEIELAVVIGQPLRNATAESAMKAIFGFTVLNDVTARDLQRRHDQWFKGKGLDTFCPIGPWIVTADEITDPHSLDLNLWVNDELRQSDNTRHMHFSIGRILADLSQGMTLQPGDIIATGTPPGVGYAMTPPHFLKPGDVVRCEIEAIGSLTNPVRLRASTT